MVMQVFLFKIPRLLTFLSMAVLAMGMDPFDGHSEEEVSEQEEFVEECLPENMPGEPQVVGVHPRFAGPFIEALEMVDFNFRQQFGSSATQPVLLNNQMEKAKELLDQLVSQLRQAVQLAENNGLNPAYIHIQVGLYLTWILRDIFDGRITALYAALLMALGGEPKRLSLFGMIRDKCNVLLRGTPEVNPLDYFSKAQRADCLLQRQQLFDWILCKVFGWNRAAYNFNMKNSIEVFMTQAMAETLNLSQEMRFFTQGKGHAYNFLNTLLERMRHTSSLTVIPYGRSAKNSPSILVNSLFDRCLREGYNLWVQMLSPFYLRSHGFQDYGHAVDPNRFKALFLPIIQCIVKNPDSHLRVYMRMVCQLHQKGKWIDTLQASSSESFAQMLQDFSENNNPYAARTALDALMNAFPDEDWQGIVDNLDEALQEIFQRFNTGPKNARKR
jgi:hypothetical protein